jgi:hypothetical protein
MVFTHLQSLLSVGLSLLTVMHSAWRAANSSYYTHFMKYLILSLAAITTIHAASITAVPGKSITLENKQLKRVISISSGIHTSTIHNKLDGKSLTPTAGHAFVIYLDDGSILTDKDFALKQLSETESAQSACFTIELSCKKPALHATLEYSLDEQDFYTRKKLTLIPAKDLKVKKIDLESLTLAEAYQPYTISQITAQGASQWRPGLGQPLYTKTSGTFWGVEFPAAVNTVKDGVLACSYLVGKTLPAGKSYTTQSSVLGVSDSPDFVKDAFFEYIDRTRARPLRLQTQYNSWFDYGRGVSGDKFAESVKHIHAELNSKRGVPPLRAYVIDDGWQDGHADWSVDTWKINKKFDANFKQSHQVTADAKSSLGLWLSPGCLFGAQGGISKMRAAGFRSLAPWMSMADPKYMGKLEERMVQLASQGVSYFKLDGVFGHLNTRNFDVPGFKGNEAELNDPKYNPQKIQYLTDGSERLINMFAAMAKAKPDVYIVISNGAWLSPFWLQHIDAVWMINAGDAAGGSSRTKELVYRDSVYYGLAVTENTQFPLHSIFNHEPKKTKSRETKETFRRYLYMNMSRGTGFVELYVKPFVLKNYDWDVLAEGLLWVHDVFPTFKRSRMHGGNPKSDEVYGYTAWLPKRGYISIHNPGAVGKDYTIKLDRAFGLHRASAKTTFHLSSPIADCTKGLKKQYRYGDTLTLTLKPQEIRILNFDVTPRNWKKLTDLQTRTKEDFAKPNPKLKPKHR